jgi:hypothetical protein
LAKPLARPLARPLAALFAPLWRSSCLLEGSEMNESYEELLERLEAVREALLEEIEKIQKDLEAIRQEHGLS